MGAFGEEGTSTEYDLFHVSQSLRAQPLWRCPWKLIKSQDFLLLLIFNIKCAAPFQLIFGKFWTLSCSRKDNLQILSE